MSETDERAAFEAHFVATPEEMHPVAWSAWQAHAALSAQRIAEAVAAEREACASRLNISRAEALLACGEMTAQEWRTVSAVLTWMQARIRRRPGCRQQYL